VSLIPKFSRGMISADPPLIGKRGEGGREREKGEGTVAQTPWGTGAGAPHHFYKWLGTGGTVSRRTNKKLTKLYSPSQKRSSKRLIVFLEPKKWRGTNKTFFGASATHFRSG